MYFLDLNEAIEERLAHPLNHRISCNLMTRLEEMLQDTKNYSKDYKKCQKWRMMQISLLLHWDNNQTGSSFSLCWMVLNKDGSTLLDVVKYAL